VVGLCEGAAVIGDVDVGDAEGTSVIGDLDVGPAEDGLWVVGDMVVTVGLAEFV